MSESSERPERYLTDVEGCEAGRWHYDEATERAATLLGALDGAR
jgi:hypothetical protein